LKAINSKNFTAEKIILLNKNCNLFILRPRLKEAHDTGEAFSHQKSTSSTSNKTWSFFAISNFVAHFLPSWIRLRRGGSTTTHWLYLLVCWGCWATILRPPGSGSSGADPPATLAVPNGLLGSLGCHFALLDPDPVGRIQNTTGYT
jgi:hypothetical protein